VSGKALDQNQDEALSIRELWNILYDSRVLIIGFTLASTMVAIVVAYAMTPVYRARALLAPVVDDAASANMAGLSASPLGNFAALAGLTVNATSARVNEAIALLQAREFTERFIEENNLLPVLFADDWDAERKAWAVEDPADAPTLADAYRVVNDIRTVSQDRRSGFVTVTVDWSDREVAARWAGLLIDGVNRRMRERTIREAERSLEFLNKELQRASVLEIQQSIYRLMEAQIKTIMLANVRDQYSFRIIDPPTVPDTKDRIRPKRTLLALLGLLLGATAGVILAFFRHALRQ
jgi:uncharacterized protein involved in exopolysaccharide biosynthesis